MTTFDQLPEDCLAQILSLTSPRDVCSSMFLSRAVYQVAASDLLWKRLLPPDYKEIISRLVSPVSFRSKKELFMKMCSPLLIDGGTKEFSIERVTNKKCYKLGVRELSIPWSSNSFYWCWKPSFESRLGQIVELINLSWLEIKGKMSIQMLSPNTYYGAYLIIKFANRAYGLDFVPSELLVQVGDYQSQRTIYLRPCIKENYSENYGWSEIEMGEFYCDGSDKEVKMSLKEIKGQHLKGGLIVEGMGSPAFVSVLLVLFLFNMHCHAQLSPGFYNKTCPKALSTIRTSIRQSIASERRMAASLIRLHFHDCFVQGCDASVLLDENAAPTSERLALPNVGSIRGFEVIEKAKSQVEKVCPGVVSCADILSVAARDASEYVGGPSWTVKLGRRDSTTANVDEANSDLPAFFSNLDRLISDFDKKGLTARDMVVLSGAHTIGQAQCFTFRDRIWSNGSDIDAGFASTRRRGCPSSGGSSNLAALDLVTPNSFDYNYFKNLMQKKGLLHSDQVLFNGGSTDNIVSEYSKNPSLFKSEFGAAMIKMGDIKPLTGKEGVIRRICSALN